MNSELDAYEILQVTPRAHADVIRAAFRALAALYHPDRDGSLASQRRMAELNAAYALVRTPERREVYDAGRANRSGSTTTSTSAPIPVAPRGDAETLDFGRYAGWTLRALAREDPDYLRWLSRHSSGIRYRQRIDELLRDLPRPTASERILGR